MFTGIVYGAYPIVGLETHAGRVQLTLELVEQLVRGLTAGASVSVDGVCLTVVHVDGTRVAFDVVSETLARTTLAERKTGDRVNVERACRVGDEIGGHLLSGHVLGTAEIAAIDTTDETHSLELRIAPNWMKYLMHKGFVALDGCSLTVGVLEKQGFRVHLIPETLRRTNLGAKRVGDRLNLEVDSATVAIVETVERVLERRVPATEER